MKIQLKSKIFRSPLAEREKSGPRFANQPAIQESLSQVCETWRSYLERYVNDTESLFHKPELPWLDTERAIVSTLSASISESFKGSLILEENRVEKLRNPNRNGRCDLWAHIPALVIDKRPLSFYLEAKRSGKKRSAATLAKFLTSKGGVSKLFRDYAKGNLNRFSQRSPYSKVKSRHHEHYVVGMFVIPLMVGNHDFEEQDAALSKAFKKILPFNLKSKTEGDPMKKMWRRLDRFPTVALMVAPDDPTVTGMIAIFTVLGSTLPLAASNSRIDS